MLQLINEIIKDNIDFQENACLVGLVSLTWLIIIRSLVYCGECDKFVPIKACVLNVKHINS